MLALANEDYIHLETGACLHLDCSENENISSTSPFENISPRSSFVINGRTEKSVCKICRFLVSACKVWRKIKKIKGIFAFFFRL